MIQRLLYLVYYLKELDRSKFERFSAAVCAQKGISAPTLYRDILVSVLRYNISILDYFYFRFFDLTPAARGEYAGTGFMYEYQLRMNPRKSRECLENKIVFMNKFRDFTRRSFADLATLKRDRRAAERLLSNARGRLVLKGARGQIGREVAVIDSRTCSYNSLLDRMERGRFDLAEEYVVQHEALMALSPSGLNTVRIVTQLHQGGVDLLGPRLRISVNSDIDNMAAGNLAAPIDLSTGVVCGPAVYSDITKSEVVRHPVTQVPIVGFQIPFWKETREMVVQAALRTPENRSVGWDVGITSTGPDLIEGNHNWCKVLWQMPARRGLKKELEKYL